MRILIAEDDSSIRMVAKMVLEQVGHHHVTTAEDGEDAYNKALADTFDLILLDEMMPKLNGLSVCQKLKAQWQTAHDPRATTPIIFLSAKSQEIDVSQFHEIGNGFIAKPFDPRVLCSQIQDLLLGRNR